MTSLLESSQEHARHACRTAPFAVEHLLVSRELGGAGVLALQLLDHFRGEGRPGRAWIPGEGPAAERASRMGLNVEKYDAAPALGRNPMWAAYANWRMGRRLRRHGPGIVHIHGPSHYGALRWAVRVSGLKSVVHVHIDETPELLTWALRRPPDLIVTCAKFLVERIRRTLPQRFQDRQRIVAVPNAVDVERFHPPGDKQAAKLKVGAPPLPLLIMLANLSPHKGQETAIRAVARLKQRGVHVVCWLAGTERGGESRFTERLHQLRTELEVADRVQLLGPRSDTADLLRAADFFLLPSTQEGLPVSLLEAQASGVPVLATPTAGIPEVVLDGQMGFLIPQPDDTGYAARVADLLANPDRGREVAARARARVSASHGWPAYCRRLEELYDELLPRPI